MTRDWIVIVPGSRWDEVPGTDKQLAVALAEDVEILWIDPPTSALSLVRGQAPRRNLHEVAPGVHRLQILVPPASTRPGVRTVSDLLVARRIRQELRDRSIRPIATIVLSARGRFLGDDGGRRILFVTDDWLSGAGMMGLDVGAVARYLDANLAAADEVAAVSPQLARELEKRVPSCRVSVIPNGTTVFIPDTQVVRQPIVGLVGQLNERLDPEILEAVADAGLSLLLVGPRTERDLEITARLDALIERPNVTATGGVPHQELRALLATMSVGLTPYLDNEFNRSSFPLKTLEYLGAGLPVVSTDLPAARWLDTPHISIGDGPAAVVALLQQRLEAEPDPAAESSRRDFANGHTWEARARQVLDLITT